MYLCVMVILVPGLSFVIRFGITYISHSFFEIISTV